MRKLRLSEVGPRYLLALVSIVQFLGTVALATIAGYMVIGGIGGTVAVMAGAKQIAAYLPAAGWVLGGIFGIGSEFERRRRSKRKKAARTVSVDDGDAPKATGTGRADNEYALRFRKPSIGQLINSLGVGCFFGGIAGLAPTVFLSVLLISVSTSPFVPKTWRPQTQAPDREELDRERGVGRQRDGVRTNFKHPMLMQIALYSTGSLIVLGLVGGAAMAFFEDDK
ncbi:MAG: hypothetical protein P8J37_05710 [Fuerstiella sp.]|nr:hypothetical protein [Fuerstiella sp.]